MTVLHEMASPIISSENTSNHAISMRASTVRLIDQLIQGQSKATLATSVDIWFSEVPVSCLSKSIKVDRPNTIRRNRGMKLWYASWWHAIQIYNQH